MTTATEPRTELVTLEPKNRAELDAARTELLGDVAHLALGIDSAVRYAEVAALEARVSAFIAKAEPLFDEHCSAAHRVWKSACEIRSLFLDGPRNIKAQCRQLLGEFKEREERERRDEERRLAEEERQRLLEVQRREAALLKKQGHAELAAAVKAQPVEAPAVTLPSTVPDVVGLTYRTDWFWTVAGGDTPANRTRVIAMLIRPEYQTYVGLLSLDSAALTSWAKRNQNVVKVPGIVFQSKQVPVRR